MLARRNEMAKIRITLLVEMDWDFSKAELSNYFENAIITLPTGEEIENGKNEKIRCLAVRNDKED
jgi:hypothetical protein